MFQVSPVPDNTVLGCKETNLYIGKKRKTFNFFFHAGGDTFVTH